jgi:hypothetical protein
VRHYLGPWQRDPQALAGAGAWVPPLGTIGAVDLRSLPEQAQATPGARPLGLFVTPVVLPSEYTSLGEGPTAEIKSSGAIRSAWQSLLGYQPQGGNLAELLFDALTDRADPSGDSAAKPLMPGADGWMDLHVVGRVKGERFEWGRSPRTNLMRDVLQREFRALWDRGGGVEAEKRREHARRVLDFWADQHSEADWREFVPPDLRGEVPGRLKHATTHTESFNKADSDTLGPDLTWTETAGDFDVVSNRISATSGSVCRAEADVSSANHYAQANIFFAGAYLGITARHAAAANTYYVGYGINTTLTEMYKRVAGSYTNLGTMNPAASSGDLYKVECNGSAIKLYIAGVQKISVTDTAIAGGTRGGFDSINSTATADAYEISDLAAAGIIYTQLERNTRGVVRGVWQGFRG